MNIVIGQDKYVRLTQYSNQAAYNLEDIVFYISKNLIQNTPQVLLYYGLNSYPFTLELDADIQNDSYNVYCVIFDRSVSLSSHIYNIKVSLGAEIINIGEVLLNAIQYKLETPAIMTMSSTATVLYDLTDSNPPIDVNIKTRKLNVPDNGEYTLVSGDNISQVIRFRIPTFVDGVDLSQRHIAIDYIPVGSTEIFSYYPKSETFEMETQADGTEYVIIPWVIKNDVTAKAGVVKFALSVTDDFDYIWQTMPATLTIQQGLGRDFGVTPNIPSVPTDAPQNYVSNIDKESNTFTVLSRKDGYIQEETVKIEELLDGGMIFSGGGAIR